MFFRFEKNNKIIVKKEVLENLFNKEYLEKNKEFFKIQNKIFLSAIKEIETERKEKIENLIFSDIENDLEEKLPMMSKKFQEFLFNFFENIDIEDEKINKIINKKTSYNLLKPDYLEKKLTLFEFIKTATSIWVWNEYIKKSSDIENFSEDENSKKNFETNYKNFLWEKLLFSTEEIKNNSIESFDSKFSKYLTFAKEHIYKIYKNINWDSYKFKSESYDDIYSSETIFDLFKKYFVLEQRIKEIKNKNDYNSDSNKYENELNQIKMWKFEIQRIFALASLYINKDATLSAQHEKEEWDYLISQVVNLWTEDVKNDFLTSWLESNNKLHNYTIKKEHFWKKDEKRNYVFSETENEWSEKIVFDSFQLEWKERDYQKNKTEVDVLHMQWRVAKHWFSTIEKFLRKEHTSLKEILDQKWLMFVVEDYKEWKKLLKILENELWTLRTSWAEEPVFMSENWNEDSNSDYNSLKWILKIPYKSKKINNFFNLIEKISWVRKMNNFFPLFKELKEKFYDKKYFIEVEIQVFDKENYIKAEIDKISPAYHWDYKEKQEIKNLPIYFPKEIYWEENLKKIIKKSLNKLKNK